MFFSFNTDEKNIALSYNIDEDSTQEPDNESKKFIYMLTMQVHPDDWLQIVDGKRLRKNYIQYFAQRFIDANISCVIKSNGFYTNKNSNFSIRFECTQRGCARKYNLKQTPNTYEFTVMRNCVPCPQHVHQHSRPMCGAQRLI